MNCRIFKIMVVMLFSFALVAACSQQSGTEEQAAAQKETQVQSALERQASAPAVEPSAQERLSEQVVSAVEEIQGTVVNTEEGIVIFSDQGSFLVAGQELDGLVGKNVKVTGIIEESDGKSVVNVTSVSLVE